MSRAVAFVIACRPAKVGAVRVVENPLNGLTPGCLLVDGPWVSKSATANFNGRPVTPENRTGLYVVGTARSHVPDPEGTPVVLTLCGSTVNARVGRFGRQAQPYWASAAADWQGLYRALLRLGWNWVGDCFSKPGQESSVKSALASRSQQTVDTLVGTLVR